MSYGSNQYIQTSVTSFSRVTVSASPRSSQGAVVNLALRHTGFGGQRGNNSTSQELLSFPMRWRYLQHTTHHWRRFRQYDGISSIRAPQRGVEASVAVKVPPLISEVASAFILPSRSYCHCQSKRQHTSVSEIIQPTS